MATSSKPVRLSGHARDQAAHRGATQSEIEDVIRTGSWQSAEGGRTECRKDFDFPTDWNGRRYATKQVRRSLSRSRTKSWS